jgi:hypothetical protein
MAEGLKENCGSGERVEKKVSGTLFLANQAGGG